MLLLQIYAISLFLFGFGKIDECFQDNASNARGQAMLVKSHCGSDLNFIFLFVKVG